MIFCLETNILEAILYQKSCFNKQCYMEVCMDNLHQLIAHRSGFELHSDEPSFSGDQVLWFVHLPSRNL